MRLDVTFRELDKKLDVDFRTGNEQIKVDFEHLQVVSDNVGVDYYKGDYTVTPKVEKQELATRQKFLTGFGVSGTFCSSDLQPLDTINHPENTVGR